MLLKALLSACVDRSPREDDPETAAKKKKLLETQASAAEGMHSSGSVYGLYMRHTFSGNAGAPPLRPALPKIVPVSVCGDNEENNSAEIPGPEEKKAVSAALTGMLAGAILAVKTGAARCGGAAISLLRGFEALKKRRKPSGVKATRRGAAGKAAQHPVRRRHGTVKTNGAVCTLVAV